MRRARNLVPRSRIVVGLATGAGSMSGKSTSGDSVTAFMLVVEGSGGSTMGATIGGGIATGARGSVALTSGRTVGAPGVVTGTGGSVAFILGATTDAPDSASELGGRVALTLGAAMTRSRFLTASGCRVALTSGVAITVRSRAAFFGVAGATNLGSAGDGTSSVCREAAV